MAAPTGSNKNLNAIPRGQKVFFWYGVTINSDGSIAVDVTAPGYIVNTGVSPPHPNARCIGYTQDGVILSFKATPEDLPVDQEDENIGESYVGKESHMKTSMLQILDFDNVAALTPGLVAVSGTGWHGVSDRTQSTFPLVPVAAIALLPSDPTRAQVQLIYAGKNVAEFSAHLAKQYQKMPLDIMGRLSGRADGATCNWYTTDPA
jgi:hypothetical protein